jgi:hypothetical protein
MQAWVAARRPLPPPHVVKQEVIEKYAAKFGLRTLVETGTYLGLMVEAMKDSFGRIYSIELDQTLYERARDRFSNDDHISIIQGDSGKVLADILSDIDEPCLFWLDGHYSGDITARGELDTPIVKELNHVFEHRAAGHVILIDDGRLFVGQDGYPTMNELRELVCRANSDWICEIEDDIIRIHKAAV